MKPLFDFIFCEKLTSPFYHNGFVIKNNISFLTLLLPRVWILVESFIKDRIIIRFRYKLKIMNVYLNRTIVWVMFYVKSLYYMIARSTTLSVIVTLLHMLFIITRQELKLASTLYLWQKVSKTALILVNEVYQQFIKHCPYKNALIE